MRATVAICTWNRSSSLRRTLEGMCKLTIPGNVEWEILVVNNRSTDETDAVIASFNGRLPIQRLWEGRPGTSYARNRALQAATGDYILWADDDILVGEEWLSAYLNAFARWPKAGLFGGPITPVFEGEPPHWLTDVMYLIGPVYGQQDLGSEPVRLTPEILPLGPYGGNMAMKRDVLLRFPFDVSVGPRHASYATGEESEVMMRMLHEGVEGWWTPDPRVGHWIPKRSQTPRYVRRWFVGCGKGEVRLQNQTAMNLAERPCRLFKRALRYELRYRIRRHRVPSNEWILDLMHAGKMHGIILGIAATRAGR